MDFVVDTVEQTLINNVHLIDVVQTDPQPLMSDALDQLRQTCLRSCILSMTAWASSAAPCGSTDTDDRLSVTVTAARTPARSHQQSQRLRLAITSPRPPQPPPALPTPRHHQLSHPGPTKYAVGQHGRTIIPATTRMIGSQFGVTKALPAIDEGGVRHALRRHSSLYPPQEQAPESD